MNSFKGLLPLKETLCVAAVLSVSAFASAQRGGMSHQQYSPPSYQSRSFQQSVPMRASQQPFVNPGFRQSPNPAFRFQTPNPAFRFNDAPHFQQSEIPHYQRLMPQQPVMNPPHYSRPPVEIQSNPVGIERFHNPLRFPNQPTPQDNRQRFHEPFHKPVTQPQTQSGQFQRDRNLNRDQGSRFDGQQRNPIRSFGSSPRIISSPAHTEQRNFTRGTQGHVFGNGDRLSSGERNDSNWDRRFFGDRDFHFRHYRHRFDRRDCFISPFGFFFGICPPFIDLNLCTFAPPAIQFVEVPVYVNDYCEGFQDTGEQSFLNDPYIDEADPGLQTALQELAEAFQGGNIDSLVPLVDKNTPIAVYERGTYKYTMSSDDYLDLTRDALENIQSVSFQIDSLHEVSTDTFSASGVQQYKDKNGKVQSMYLSFVLKDIDGRWTLIQVGTAPGEYQDPASMAQPD